jgi:hypothetical protein
MLCVLASMEESIACEDDLVPVVLHEPADAVLSVAWRVHGLHLDRAKVEGLAVLGRPRDGLTVLPADDF